MGGLIKTAGGLLGFSGANSQAAAVPKKYWTDPYLADNTQTINDEQSRILGQGAFQAANTQLNTGASDQDRTSQMQLMQQLQNRVNGTGGPSVAEQQLFSGQQSNLHNALAMSASQRGNVNAGLAQRNLLNNSSQSFSDTNTQAALLRAQEQQTAEQNLGGLLGTIRSGDQSQAGTQAGLDQQTALANLQSQIGQRGLAEQSNQNLLAQLMTEQGNQFQARQNLGGRLAGAQQQDNAARGQFVGGMLNQAGPLISNVASGIGSLFSDKRAKENIAPSSDKIKVFLDEISSQEFNYKNPTAEGAAQGRRYGVMAQDLEKSEVGKALVKDTPQGKMIDGPQAIGTLLAAVSDLNKRMNKKAA